jgi:hypothetical protein
MVHQGGVEGHFSMVKFLLWFKRRFGILWKVVETLNGVLVGFLFSRTIKSNLTTQMSRAGGAGLDYRFLRDDDLDALVEFFESQEMDQFEYFKPHAFDLITLRLLLKSKSFFMMGVFDECGLVGYFYLRCFANKKAFTGRIVDPKCQGRGISKQMGQILLISAWESGLRVFGTTSRENVKSLNSYKSISELKILKDLGDGYVLFEYLESGIRSK